MTMTSEPPVKLPDDCLPLLNGKTASRNGSALEPPRHRNDIADHTVWRENNSNALRRCRGRRCMEGSAKYTHQSLPDLPLQAGIGLAKFVALGAKFSDLCLLECTSVSKFR